MKTKINFPIYIILITVLFLSFTACNKNEDFIAEIDEIVAENIDISSEISNNFTELNKRMSSVHQPILFTGDNFKNSQMPIPPSNECEDYTWYLVAEVDAPIYNGEPLSASDVRILDNRAYVSYHSQGSIYAGGLDVIDISDPAFPSILSYMEFDGVDINSLAIDDRGSDEGERKIWLAGSSYKKGAVLRQVIANNGNLSSSILDISLSKAMKNGTITPSANGIGYSDDYIYMTAGNSAGGTFQLDRQTLSIVANEEYSDAKAIALNGTNTGDYQLTLVAGDNAKLNVHRVGNDRSLVRSIDLGTIIHQNVAEPYLGKSTVTIREGENIAFIAMNSGGMKGIDITTGAEVYYSSSNMLTTGNTHGLTVDDHFVYMANSDDGLSIGCIPDGGGEITNVQHWDLDEVGASANMVQTDGDWVFVAKGGGGLKILRKVKKEDIPTLCDWDADGAPLCNTNEDLCENLIADFKVVLPEYENALVNHPDYFLNENREILLTESGEVSVTFVMEGAGFTNTFGYYTYNKNNPPQTVEEIKSSMTIVFANASSGGKGTLEEGDKMNLGTFEAGTVIGYFLIADGWDGNNITEGYYTFFTNPALNRNGSQQSIMMYSESCGSLLTAFEDVHISGGDKDYNDLVIKTSISPMSAMSTSALVQL